MAVKPIPDGYHTVTPYLIVPGAEKLIEFLKQAFYASEVHIMRGPGESIVHAEVKIGDSRVMISDANEQFPPMPACIHLYLPDADASYRRALAAGSVSLREPTDQFYGDRSAGVKDQFGNMWWIGTHIEDVSPEEMEKRMKAHQ